MSYITTFAYIRFGDLRQKIAPYRQIGAAGPRRRDRYQFARDMVESKY